MNPQRKQRLPPRLWGSRRGSRRQCRVQRNLAIPWSAGPVLEPLAKGRKGWGGEGEGGGGGGGGGRRRSSGNCLQGGSEEKERNIFLDSILCDGDIIQFVPGFRETFLCPLLLFLPSFLTSFPPLWAPSPFTKLLFCWSLLVFLCLYVPAFNIPFKYQLSN